MKRKITPDTAVNFQGMEQRTANLKSSLSFNLFNKLKLVSFVSIFMGMGMNLYSQNNELNTGIDAELIKFPAGTFPTLPLVPTPIYKFENTLGGIPPNDGLTIFSEGTIATNHGLIGGFGLFGNATDFKWNALGVRIPATPLPYLNSTGLRSSWGQGGANFGMALPYPSFLILNPDRRDALVSWQDATAPEPLLAQNRLVFGVRDGSTTDFEEVAQIATNNQALFGIGIIDPAGPIIPDEQLHLYDFKPPSGTPLPLYIKWSNTFSPNGARIGFPPGSNNNFQIRNEENASIEFWTNNQQRMQLFNNGTLGIGFLDPLIPLPPPGTVFDQKLELYDFLANTLFQRWRTITSSINGGAKIGVDNTNQFQIRNEENANIEFWTDGASAATPRMTIDNTGWVGIGTSAIIGAEKLNVNGHIFPAGPGFDLGYNDPNDTWNEVYGVNAYTTTSDKRYKTNIRPLSYGLSEIMRLNTHFYEWKTNPNGIRIGFIAQEIFDIIPEVVVRGEGEAYMMRYSELIPVLVNGIKELKRQIDSIDREEVEIEKLKSENNNLKLQNQQLESRLNALEDFVYSQKGIGEGYGQTGKLNNPASLEQNEPNPFAQETVIRYFLPEGSTNAKIEVKNSEGKVVGSFALSRVGHGNITLSAGSISAGIYFYSLVINNNIVETKKMILLN